MDTQKPANPGSSRRGLLKCMAWAGTGIVWTVAGGVPRGLGLGGEAFGAPMDGFTFVQISDSHIGFNKEANPDPNATGVPADPHSALPGAVTAFDVAAPINAAAVAVEWRNDGT